MQHCSNASVEVQSVTVDEGVDRYVRERLWQGRVESGFSLAEFSTLTAVSEQQIERYESGADVIPPHYMNVATKALGQQIDWLYKDIGAVSNCAAKMAEKTNSDGEFNPFYSGIKTDTFFGASSWSGVETVKVN